MKRNVPRTPVTHKAEVSATITEENRGVVEKSILYEAIYSVGGLILGLLCIVGGIILSILGVTGSIDWSAEILGAESTISNAAPGAVLFIVGVAIVFLTRYKVNLKAKEKKDQ